MSQLFYSKKLGTGGGGDEGEERVWHIKVLREGDAADRSRQSTIHRAKGGNKVREASVQKPKQML